jgi:predicted RNase H-like HicB family nuclease
MGTVSDLRFEVETEREDDGRWIAEIASLPGVLAYGSNRNEALAAAEALALRVVADRLEHGEMAPDHVSLSFINA